MVETADQATDQTPDAKPCPYCGESLKPGALVCRHCRRDLSNPDAPPMVALHDWERETPPEKVVFTVRLPVSEGQWAITCYVLAVAVGIFWLGLLRRPGPVPNVTTTQGTPTSVALTASPSPELTQYTPDSTTSSAVTVPDRVAPPAAISSIPLPREPMGQTPAENAAGGRPVSASFVVPKSTKPTPLPPAEKVPEAMPPPPPRAADAEDTMPGLVREPVHGVSGAASSTPGDPLMWGAVAPRDTAVTDSDALTSRYTTAAAGETLSAAALVRTYAAAPERARTEYTGHSITITGVVKAVGRGADKSPFVVLAGTKNTSVRCLFTTERGKAVPAVRVGSRVTIAGKCEGWYVEVMLSEAKLL